MDYISDSDGDNSLPVLSPQWVDKVLLRDIFSILSSASKSRIRDEARGTPMETLYDEIESLNDSSQMMQLADTSTLNAFETSERLLYEIPTNENERISASGLKTLNPVQITSLPLRQATRASEANEVTHHVANNMADFTNQRVSGRSLRKRTFASRHPYIADQADWLGICTVDSINEMFNDDEDISKVVKALNHLYLKRKRRYPGEDRYKAKNFYAHLGKSKLLAVTGDRDISNLDVITQTVSQSIGEADEEDYQTDDQEEEEEDDDDQLIPYEGLIQASTMKDVLPSETHEFSSSSETESSEEEEQLIRIGGKYRKLSRILRGVLPESARRLSMFQEKKQVKKKKNIVKPLQPQKGLAIKKVGSSYAQSEELRRELNSFIDTNQLEEDYKPNHQNIFLHSIPDFAHEQVKGYSVSELSSNSDSDSDSVEEVFSDSIRGDLTPAFSLSNVDPHLGYIDADSDSAYEADHINYMFASGSKAASNKKPTKVSRVPARHRSFQERKTTSKAARVELKDLTNLSNRNRKRSSSRSSTLGTLKRRKLSSPVAQRTTQSTNASSKDAREGKNVKSGKAKDQKRIQKQHILHQRPIDKSFQRDPIKSTTVFEVESSTNFIHNRGTYGVSNLEAYIPSKELLFGDSSEFDQTDILPYSEFSRVNTIGDGHIFFNGEDGVVFTLVGKRYSLGLYRFEASLNLTEKYFIQLRKIVLDLNMMLSTDIRAEIHKSLKSMVKWILIARKSPLETLWKQLHSLLNDFTKLQTRLMRQHQSMVHCRLLFIFYIYMRMEVAGLPTSEAQLVKAFDAHCSDYWSVFFQSFSATEISHEISTESKSNMLSDSLKLMCSMFKTNQLFWWQPINEALHDSVLVIVDKVSLMDVIYILASIVPKSKYNWGCFLAVLGDLKKDKYSLAFHHFIDICVLATQRLSWPLNERVITQLYSTFAQRKFGNFADETFVPRALGTIHTRLDIPDSSVFERFMSVLYNYVSDLSSKKDLKRLVSKLVASSQYQYQNGRKYQIQFVNRINLISLLSQVSDVDLSSPFTNLVELISTSKDMFIYGRAIDALLLLCEVENSRGDSLPLKAIEILLKSFCQYFGSLFGMPDLLKRTIHFISDSMQCNKSTNLFKLMSNINMTSFPDGDIMSDLLSMILFSCFEVEARAADLTPLDIENVSNFQKSLLNLLGTQMGRMTILQARQQERVEESIEIAIQIWMLTASITGTQHWNIVMLQKYPYIGNSDLREYFVLFMCEEYMKSGPLDASIIGEIDAIMLKCLASFSISKYALTLYSRLSRTPRSIFCFKKPPSLDLSTLIQLQTFRSLLLLCVIQNLCALSSYPQEIKISFLRGVVVILQNEYSKNFTLSVYVDFCKHLVDLIQRIAKSILNDMDEFWDFAVKLGFANKKMQLAWSESNELDRLQMLNNEFLNALQYNKAIKSALEKWISLSHLGTVYSLVQIYISAVPINESHWAHLSHLLNYVFFKLQSFQLKVQECAFKTFLELLVDVAAMSSRWNNDSYIIYQLDAISTCSLIYQHAYYIYDGYRDKSEYLRIADQFISEIDKHASKEFDPKNPFTNVTFGMLRNASHSSYLPPFQHTTDDYSKAYVVQDTQLSTLKKKLHPEKIDCGLEFDFDI